MTFDLSKATLLKLLGEAGADVKRFEANSEAELAKVLYDQLVRHVYPDAHDALAPFGIEPGATSFKALLARIDFLHAERAGAQAILAGLQKRLQECQARIATARTVAEPWLQAWANGGGIQRQAVVESEELLLRHMNAVAPSVDASKEQGRKLDVSFMLAAIQKEVCVRKFWICNAGVGMFWRPYDDQDRAYRDGLADMPSEAKFKVDEYYDTMGDCIECEYNVHVLKQPRESRPRKKGPFVEQSMKDARTMPFGDDRENNES